MFILHVYFALSNALNILVCTHTVNIILRAVMATRLDGKSIQYLDSFTTLRNATGSFVMSVRPSAWNNSIPAGGIFLKLYIKGVFLRSVEKIQVWLN
jgi:hypothetical protein